MVSEYRMKEEDLKGTVKHYFEKQGFEGFDEVRIRKKRIDLYFIHKYYPKTIAVELKIRKWKQALRQAYQNLYYAQKSYVGLWHKAVKPDTIVGIDAYGLGILEIEKDKVNLIRKPRNRCYGILPSTKVIINNKITSKNRSMFLWRTL